MRVRAAIARALAVDRLFRHKHNHWLQDVYPSVAICRYWLAAIRSGAALIEPRLVSIFTNEIDQACCLRRSLRDLYPRCIFDAQSPPAAEMAAYLDRLAGGVESTRVHEIRYRAMAEAEDALEAGWYIIMDTLTVAPHLCHDRQEALSGRGWARYKERIQECVRQALGLRQGEVPIADYARYVGVVEGGRGGNNGHIHVLWYLRDIPLSWRRCPNKGRVVPERREIDAAKSSWEYGYSTPTAVRTGASDPWSRLGWTWPVDSDKRPIAACGAGGVAAYITKYMTKMDDHVPWRTRVRVTRGLGYRRIDAWLADVPAMALRPLSCLTRSADWLISTRGRWRVPLRLIRQRALRLRLQRVWASRPTLTLTWEARRPRYQFYASFRVAWPEIRTLVTRSSVWSDSVWRALGLDLGGSSSRIGAAQALVEEYWAKPVPARGRAVSIGGRYAA